MSIFFYLSTYLPVKVHDMPLNSTHDMVNTREIIPKWSQQEQPFLSRTHHLLNTYPPVKFHDIIPNATKDMVLL